MASPGMTSTPTTPHSCVSPLLPYSDPGTPASPRGIWEPSSVGAIHPRDSDRSMPRLQPANVEWAQRSPTDAAHSAATVRHDPNDVEEKFEKYFGCLARCEENFSI